MLSIIAGHLGNRQIEKVVFSYHLSVFFILSGYTLKNNLSKETVNQKFRSIMGPYFITCFAVCVFRVFNTIVINHDSSVITVTKVIANCLQYAFMGSGATKNFGTVELGGRIGAIWFLPALFFATLQVQCLLKYIAGKREQYIISLSLAIFGFLSARFIWLPFSFQSSLLAAPFVLLGYDCREYGYLEKLRFRDFAFYLTVFFFGLITNKTVISFVRCDAPDIILTPIYTLASSLCVIYLSQKMGNCRGLSWIGRNSIYFLCVHLIEGERLGYIYTALGLSNSLLLLFIAKTILISFATAIVLKCKQLAPTSISAGTTSGRDNALDIAKAFLIIIMIMGHIKLDRQMRGIIYSFHMAAFIFFSGYCFKEGSLENMSRTIKNLVKSFLMPYGLFGILYVITQHAGIKAELQTLALGMSFSQKLFTDATSVGPVYFILLLFGIRLIYTVTLRYIYIYIFGVSLGGLQQKILQCFFFHCSVSGWEKRNSGSLGVLTARYMVS